MLEVLHFVFSSFWVWLGTVVLLAVVSNATFTMIGLIVAAIFNRGRTQ